LTDDKAALTSDRDDRLPPWLLWSERPFPDTNLLLLAVWDRLGPP
jgi:hypothetical protein